LPVYKQRIAALAQQIPDHVSFKDLVSLRYLVYQDGKIRQNSTSGQGPDVLQKYYLVSPEEELRNYPPLGAHQVFYGGIPELWGAMPTTTIPDSMISLTNGTLALDRILTVPPIAMDAARAEKMWKRPDCLPYPASYRHQGMKPKDAEAAAAECMAERQSYEDGLTLDFDINVEGVVEGKQGWVIKAHVNKVDIYSPRHELLKTIAGADLPPADDVWQRQSDEQAAKQKEEAETQAREAEAQAREQAQKQTLARVEQDRLSAEREKLRNADIIGIRLGMTLSEAEQIIRNHMHVGWVGDLGGKIAPGIKANQPYIQHFRTFINKEGREVVALYWDSKSSDRIVAVTRSLRLPTGASPEDVTAQLLKKYGDQPANKSDRELLWTADFGNQQGQIHDAATYSNSTCSSVLGTIGIIYLKFQDGKDYRSIDKNLFDLIPSPGFIQVDGGQFSDKYGNWQWDSTQWKNCGPAVLAEIQPEDNMGKEYSLVVGLHDLAAYAPLYAAETQEKKNAVDINLNL
jgi:hypothetical protein